MATNGLLGKGNSNADLTVRLYTVPGSVQFATVSIYAVNYGVEDAKLTVYVSYTDAPGLGDLMDFEIVIPANGGAFERTCFVLSPNERILIKSDKNTVVTQVRGLESI